MGRRRSSYVVNETVGVRAKQLAQRYAVYVDARDLDRLVEAAWSIIDPIIAQWEQSDKPPLYTYEPGFWGPEQSTQWMASQGRQWFDTCPVLH